MAYGQAKHNISIPAASDLTGDQFLLVALDGDIAGAGELCFPLQNDMAKPGGEPASLCVAGVSQVYFGDTVTKGAALTSEAGGKAVPATDGDQIIGYALEAGADGELRTMLVLPNGLVPDPA